MGVFVFVLSFSAYHVFSYDITFLWLRGCNAVFVVAFFVLNLIRSRRFLSISLSISTSSTRRDFTISHVVYSVDLVLYVLSNCVWLVRKIEGDIIAPLLLCDIDINSD